MKVILQADQRPKQNHKDEILPAHPQELDVEPGKQSLSDYEVSKKLIRLLCHGSLQREDDGAIEFWRIKDNLQKHFLYCHHWSDEKWKKSMARGGGNKKRYQYCTSSSGAILYLRALQGHSGRSLIDPTLQDNVIIPDGFFQYIYHVGCAINLHSIINSGLITGCQNLSNRQTLFFLPVDPIDKNHKDLDTIDLSVPRHAQYMHKSWKKHQNTVYWVDINLALQKGLKFYQNTIERYHSSRNTPSVLYSESCSDGNWRSHIREGFCVTSSSSKDFFETRLDERIGFRSCSTTRGRTCSTIQKFPIKPTKSKPRS